jgi:hypothetical protein
MQAKKILLACSLFIFHISFSQKPLVKDTAAKNVIKSPITKKHSPHKSSFAGAQYFQVGKERIKYAVFHTDTINISDTLPPFVTSIAEYMWDTINSGYIYVIKEQRLFCDEVKPEILQGDLKNMLKIMPENGFRHLDKAGGEFRVNIEEALYDGGEDSVFIAVDIEGFIGGAADFEEHGVVGMRYIDLLHCNDSLYKSPDHYPMNRFNKEMTLR